MEKDLMQFKNKLEKNKKDMNDYIYNNFELRKHINAEKKKREALTKMLSDLEKKVAIK